VSWAENTGADCMGVQEVKAQAADVAGRLERLGNLSGHFHFAEKKGYSTRSTSRTGAATRRTAASCPKSARGSPTSSTKLGVVDVFARWSPARRNTRGGATAARHWPRTSAGGSGKEPRRRWSSAARTKGPGGPARQRLLRRPLPRPRRQQAQRVLRRRVDRFEPRVTPRLTPVSPAPVPRTRPRSCPSTRRSRGPSRRGRRWRSAGASSAPAHRPWGGRRRS